MGLQSLQAVESAPADPNQPNAQRAEIPIPGNDADSNTPDSPNAPPDPNAGLPGAKTADDPNHMPDQQDDPNATKPSEIQAVVPEKLSEDKESDESGLMAAVEPVAASPDDQPEPSDPNDPLELSDDDDTFYPRLSILIEINEAWQSIFIPELVNEKGNVDYGTLRRKRQDLVRAMKGLKELNPAVLMAMSRPEKIAFWINTYNVCMLDLVIRNYPIESRPIMGIFYPDNSIMQISGSWRTKTFFEIQGFEYTLQEIEEEFLLDRYKDPRLIFALAYASEGGAPLRDEPYTAEKLDDQLNDQVTAYLQSPEGLLIDRRGNTVYLSNLFSMHGHRDLFLESEYAEIKKFRDRPADEQAWLNFIWQYVSPEDRTFLETTAFQVKFIKYDWALNEA